MAWSLVWASLNWLLDAASLWCFVAAFGHLTNPVELFAAYGIANVAGRAPADAGRARGRGLDHPAAACRLRRHQERGHARRPRLAGGQLLAADPDRRRRSSSLKVKPGQGRAAVETAVSGMFAVVGARSPYATSPAAAPEPQPHSPAGPGPSEQQTPQEPPDSGRSDSGRSDSGAAGGRGRGGSGPPGGVKRDRLVRPLPPGWALPYRRDFRSHGEGARSVMMRRD